MPHLRSWSDLINASGFRSALRGTVQYFFGKRGKRRIRWLRVYYRIRLQVVLKATEPIGRLARRREVRLWVDGKESFRRIEQLIRRAQHHIVIQMFIWKNDRTGRYIAQLLLDAAQRGVVIDIAKEAVGDFFEFQGDFLGTKGSAQEPWPAFWNHPRIHVTHASDNDHTKVFVIDNHTLLLTGMNIADEYLYDLHDYLVELRGEDFVRQFLTRSQETSPSQQVQLVMNVGNHKDIRPVLQRILMEARTHVVIEHCYMSDPEVTDILIGLTMRGVRLTIILPKWADFHYHANMVMVGRLLAQAKKGGVKILIYPTMFHSKVILVDHAVVFIGSANLFQSSLDEMGEMNVLIRGKKRVLWKLRETLRHDVLLSRALTGPPPLLWVSRWLAWLGL